MNYEARQKDRIIITISADRGEVYNFGAVTFEGNSIFCDEEITNQFLFAEGDSYSPEAIRDTVKRISDFYGRRGYIDAIVDYEPRLDCATRTYSIQNCLNLNCSLLKFPHVCMLPKQQ
ncbi:MAG: hypothetical protein HYZ42_08745 [Bacteroidetes bacterium]|nr:hypothetical protein [Bacteroidota bacterium]